MKTQLAGLAFPCSVDPVLRAPMRALAIFIEISEQPGAGLQPSCNLRRPRRCAAARAPAQLPYPLGAVPGAARPPRSRGQCRPIRIGAGQWVYTDHVRVGMDAVR